MAGLLFFLCDRFTSSQEVCLIYNVPPLCQNDIMMVVVTDNGVKTAHNPPNPPKVTHDVGVVAVEHFALI